MPIDFNAIAERAATVMVGGEEVVVRQPSLEHWKALRESGLGQAHDGDPIGNLVAMHTFVSKMMADMVVTEEPVSAENWARIIKMPKEQWPDPEGIANLIATVMRTLGLDDSVFAGPSLGDKVQDHVQEAADVVGKPDTT